MGGGRRWNRENAVCTADRSTADMDRGDDHFICADQVKQQTAANDIRDCVQRTNFVKMNLVDRGTVSMGFRITDQAIDCRSIFFDGLRQV